MDNKYLEVFFVENRTTRQEESIEVDKRHGECKLAAHHSEEKIVAPICAVFEILDDKITHVVATLLSVRLRLPAT